MQLDEQASACVIHSGQGQGAVALQRETRLFSSSKCGVMVVRSTPVLKQPSTTSQQRISSHHTKVSSAPRAIGGPVSCLNGFSARRSRLPELKIMPLGKEAGEHCSEEQALQCRPPATPFDPSGGLPSARRMFVRLTTSTSHNMESLAFRPALVCVDSLQCDRASLFLLPAE